MAVASPVSAATQGEINNAISKGVVWLAAQQCADGSWCTSGYSPAHTGFVVLKLEDYAIEQGKNPLDPAYVYSPQIKAGLNYLFTRVQADGRLSDPGTSYADVYTTSISIMAITESGAPNTVISGTGNPNADGKTYKQIVQGAVDWLVAAQTTEGGWYYYSNPSGGYGSSDQSNSGYATLALTYAQKFGISIPTSTLTGIGNWVTVIQDNSDGSSKYMTYWAWPNIYKTGSLLQQFKMVGRGTGDSNVDSAVTYIGNHWNDGGGQGWIGDHQGCFALMKGFEAQGITTITVGGNPVNWYDDVADWIVSTQNSDGSWPSDSWGDPVLTTSWSLLTLEKTTEVPPAAFGVVKSADTLSVSPGGSVTYTYLVSNTGLVPISGIVLTDNKLGVIAGPASGDTNTNGVLDPLETWIYATTTNLFTTTTNTAIATGADPTGGAPVSTTSNGVTVAVTGGGGVPEFPTLALPAAMILGIMFVAYSLRISRKD